MGWRMLRIVNLHADVYSKPPCGYKRGDMHTPTSQPRLVSRPPVRLASQTQTGTHLNLSCCFPIPISMAAADMDPAPPTSITRCKHTFLSPSHHLPNTPETEVYARLTARQLERDRTPSPPPVISLRQRHRRRKGGGDSSVSSAVSRGAARRVALLVWCSALGDVGRIEIGCCGIGLEREGVGWRDGLDGM